MRKSFFGHANGIVVIKTTLILQREISDPRIGFVTINEVIVSKDLAVTKIYVAGKKASTKALNELSPLIRHALAKRIRLRHISELRFYYDDSFDTGMRVAELLNEVSSDLVDKQTVE